MWEEEGREHDERGHMFQDGRYYWILFKLPVYPGPLEWSELG